MEKSDNYKSPITALLWSLAMPGFGQLYNKHYIIGIVLLIHEFVVNIHTHLNVSILYTFRGDFDMANKVVDYEWGLFYPSIFCFSLWHAFNEAHAINRRNGNSGQKKRVYLTGFFFGMVTGMNFGINWYDSFLTHYLAMFQSPVISGIACGLIAAFAGLLFESMIRKLT